MDLEKQRMSSSVYRVKLLEMLGELQRYIQPSQTDKVMLMEMEQRERARDLIHETIKQFENTTEGGEVDFATLKNRMEKIYAKQKQLDLNNAVK